MSSVNHGTLNSWDAAHELRLSRGCYLPSFHENFSSFESFLEFGEWGRNKVGSGSHLHFML